MKKSGRTSLHFPKIVESVDWQRKVIPFRDNPSLVLEALRPVIDSADAHSDVPWPGLYQQISAAYPDAKFVFMKRDPEKWFNSVAHHWSLGLLKRRLSPFEYIQYLPYFAAETGRLFGIRDRAKFIDAFNAHEIAVKKQLPEDRLLVLDIGDPESNLKIAAFAGISSISAFPHVGKGNKKTAQQRLKNNMITRWKYEFYVLLSKATTTARELVRFWTIRNSKM